MKHIIALAAMVGIGYQASAQDANSLVARIKAVGREGAGNVETAQAWQQLVKQGPDVFGEILTGLNGATPTAANWLRSAFDHIAETTQKSGKPLPAARLEAFVQDRSNAGAARRLAYEWLLKADANAADRLLPGMLDDPGQELRRDAVAVKLQEAAKLTDNEKSKAAYTALFKAARDKDQVTAIADKLKKLGTEIDLTKHFGFVTSWALVGPFNNVKGVGFDTVYPPEKGVDLKATYQGKDDKVNWFTNTTKESLGVVDLNKVVSPLKGAVYFGYAEVDSPVERPIEVRAGSNNAIRIYLNGKEVYFREEYHHGMQMDQHIGKAVLKKGKNQILIKVCQNEQTESWAQQWSFQLRLTDDLGAAVAFATVTPEIKK